MYRWRILGTAVSVCLLASIGHAAPLYAALGASDAVGVGATSPNSQDPSLPNNGYVYRIAYWLRTRDSSWALSNHGVSGAEAPAVVQGQLSAAVAENPTLVTLWVGGNDIKNSVVQFEATSALVARFQPAFTTLIRTLREQTNATIVTANLPDLSKLPVAAYFPTAYKQLAHADSLALSGVIASVAAQYHVPVVDLYSDPRSTDPAYIYTDGFHPNDAGYAVMAQKYEAMILGDVDAGGSLNVADAVAALGISSGMAAPTDMQRITADACPPGGDKTIGLSDAVQILRHLNGLVPDADWR